MGGVTYHKEFFLLKKAILQGHFENLEVLVIDHAMKEGDKRHEQWGTVPVTIRAKLPQDQVNKLYSMIDVLIATSMWPESYGLVTREARFYGKFIVSSDLGAISDPVVPGENGFVVDVQNVDELVSVLAEIDRDAEKYKAATSSEIPQRTSAQQISEYVNLYRAKGLLEAVALQAGSSAL